MVWLQLFAHRVGHHVIYPHDPTGTYYDVRRAGWHPFWDRLPTIFNPDSEFVRDGGMQEPRHAEFECGRTIDYGPNRFHVP